MHAETIQKTTTKVRYDRALSITPLHNHIRCRCFADTVFVVAVDDISEQGINLHERVFGSGWKADLQMRMTAGGNTNTLDRHDAMYVVVKLEDCRPPPGSDFCSV